VNGNLTSRQVLVGRFQAPGSPLAAGTVVQLPADMCGRVVGVTWSASQDTHTTTDFLPRWALAPTTSAPNLQDPSVLAWTPTGNGWLPWQGQPRYLIAVDGWTSARAYLLSVFLVVEVTR
jgi:hypothetical protein